MTKLSLLALLCSALAIGHASAQTVTVDPGEEVISTDETDPAPISAQRQAPPPAPPIQTVKIVGKQTYDSLRLRMVMNFPSNVKTVQQATQYMLETVNFKLILNPANPEQTKRILSRPLLPQDRDGSLKTIEDGLLQISGDDTLLVIDRKNKLITFELMEKQ
jgi:hypothetical protein